MDSWSIQTLLLLLTFGISVFWYLSFLWKRRNLYNYSRKVPGPLAFPLIGSAYLFLADFSSTGILNVLLNVQKTYPGLCKIWIGPRLMYFLTEPEHIEKVLTNKNALHKNYVYDIISQGVGTGILTAPVEKWKIHRKLIRPSFGQKYLNSYVSIFAKHAAVLSNELKRYVGKKNVATFPLFSRLTFDITFENIVGIPISTQTTHSIFPKMFERAFEIVVKRVFGIWLQFDIVFKLSSLGKEFQEIINTFRGLSILLIESKKKKLELKKSLETTEFLEVEPEEEMRSFVDTAIEKSYFTDDDLRQELEVTIMAANDTTASALTFLFEILGLYQDVQQKVYEEAVEVLGKDREVESSDLQKLKYTERVIQESLRLFPPVSVFFRRIGEDIDLGDAVLPKDASVCVCTFYVHRIPKLWPDPLKFDTDRFLPEQVTKRHPCAHVPFSYGPRNCIGYQYGLLSMKTIVATVIRRYKFSTGYKSLDDMKTKLSLFLRLDEGSKLSVSLREDV